MESDTINIRRATTADIEIIVSFNIEIARETENTILPRCRLTNGVVAMFEDDAKGFYIVAECGGRMVGQTMITYEWSDWRNGMFWWIQSVYVIPPYRKKGVFRTLFQHVKLMAEETPDICGLRLYVHQDNHTAKTTYKNLSMKKSHYEFYEMLLSNH